MNTIFSIVMDWLRCGSRNPETWEQVRNQWLSCEWIEAGRTGHDARLPKGASLLLDLVVSNRLSAQLAEQLDDENAQIVGYCLIGLELLNCPVLQALPEELSRRSEPIKISSGHTVLEIPLNAFAQGIESRHKEGKSLERWLSFGYKTDASKLEELLENLRARK